MQRRERLDRGLHGRDEGQRDQRCAHARLAQPELEGRPHAALGLRLRPHGRPLEEPPDGEQRDDDGERPHDRLEPDRAHDRSADGRPEQPRHDGRGVHHRERPPAVRDGHGRDEPGDAGGPADGRERALCEAHGDQLAERVGIGQQGQREREDRGRPQRRQPRADPVGDPPDVQREEQDGAAVGAQHDADLALREAQLVLQVGVSGAIANDEHVDEDDRADERRQPDVAGLHASRMPRAAARGRRTSRTTPRCRPVRRPGRRARPRARPRAPGQRRPAWPRSLRDATRSCRPARSTTCSCGARSSSTGPKSRDPARSLSSSSSPILGADLLRQAHHPGVAVDAHVPDDPERPARPQHACALRRRGALVEPVPGLPDADRVDARVGERDVLGRARQGLGARHGGDQLLAHAVRRLDGRHAMAGSDQLARQLAGAGGQVEHVTRRLRREPGDDLGGVERPGALVGGGHGAERARALLPGGLSLIACRLRDRG